jgi:hypothetical protein
LIREFLFRRHQSANWSLSRPVSKRPVVRRLFDHPGYVIYRIGIALVSNPQPTDLGDDRIEQLFMLSAIDDEAVDELLELWTKPSFQSISFISSSSAYLPVHPHLRRRWEAHLEAERRRSIALADRLASLNSSSVGCHHPRSRS